MSPLQAETRGAIAYAALALGSTYVQWMLSLYGASQVADVHAMKPELMRSLCDTLWDRIARKGSCASH